MIGLQLTAMNAAGIAEAQGLVTAHHYLHRPVDVRTMPEGFWVKTAALGRVGLLLFGRPEATRCYPWYGSVDDVATGRAEVTRWQVLNLSRVWFTPEVQPGGAWHDAEHLPGFFDRRGVFRSTLASAAIRVAVHMMRSYYLLRRPPVFLEEPYELRYCLSYCDTRLHRGTIYAAAGFELYRTNDRGIQTWRRPLDPLERQQDALVRRASETNTRAIRMRGRRAQLAFAL